MIMDVLLVFVPIAIALEVLASDHHLLIFVASSLAILPLAGWKGHEADQKANPCSASVRTPSAAATLRLTPPLGLLTR